MEGWGYPNRSDMAGASGPIHNTVEEMDYGVLGIAISAWKWYFMYIGKDPSTWLLNNESRGIAWSRKESSLKGQFYGIKLNRIFECSLSVYETIVMASWIIHVAITWQPKLGLSFQPKAKSKWLSKPPNPCELNCKEAIKPEAAFALVCGCEWWYPMWCIYMMCIMYYTYTRYSTNPNCFYWPGRYACISCHTSRPPLYKSWILNIPDSITFHQY